MSASPARGETRLVALDAHAVGKLRGLAESFPVVAGVVAAWDAAAVGPAEAVTNALAVLDGYPTSWSCDADWLPALQRDAAAVLKALGWEARDE